MELRLISSNSQTGMTFSPYMPLTSRACRRSGPPVDRLLPGCVSRIDSRGRPNGRRAPGSSRAAPRSGGIDSKSGAAVKYLELGIRNGEDVSVSRQCQAASPLDLDRSDWPPHDLQRTRAYQEISIAALVDRRNPVLRFPERRLPRCMRPVRDPKGGWCPAWCTRAGLPGPDRPTGETPREQQDGDDQDSQFWAHGDGVKLIRRESRVALDRCDRNSMQFVQRPQVTSELRVGRIPRSQG